eukprot:COSAG02_NODE_431_length_22447_cov_7.487202_12_plen_147_part_00
MNSTMNSIHRPSGIFRLSTVFRSGRASTLVLAGCILYRSYKMKNVVLPLSRLSDWRYMYAPPRSQTHPARRRVCLGWGLVALIKCPAVKHAKVRRRLRVSAHLDTFADATMPVTATAGQAFLGPGPPSVKGGLTRLAPEPRSRNCA